MSSIREMVSSGKFPVYHQDMEYGIFPAEFRLVKIIEVARFRDGKLSAYPYLKGYDETEIETLKTKVSEFDQRDLEKEYRDNSDGFISMSQSEYCSVWTDDHASNCENLKRIEAANFSILVVGN